LNGTADDYPDVALFERADFMESTLGLVDRLLEIEDL
jgi:hypothetical protein